MRDSQRQRCYAAERDAFRSWLQGPGRSLSDHWVLPSAEEVEARVAELASTIGVKVPRVLDGGDARQSWARRYDHTISIARHGRVEWVLVHELTHLQVMPPFPAHGIEYCAQYLINVARCLGEVHAERLAAAFRLRGVRYEYDDAHQRKVEADLRWRAARPVWGEIHGSGKRGYSYIELVLKDGSMHLVWARNGAWDEDRLAEAQRLVAERKVAYATS